MVQWLNSLVTCEDFATARESVMEKVCVSMSDSTLRRTGLWPVMQYLHYRLLCDIPEPTIRFSVMRAAAAAGKLSAGNDTQILLGLRGASGQQN